MLNNILLIITSLFIPAFIFLGLHLYNYSNERKLSRILIITTLSLELLRFFYNASFYEKAKTPSGYLTFSFITFLIVFGLFATFNQTKLGVFFKKVFTFSFFIPTVFALFAPRVYLSEKIIIDGVEKYLDTYSVLPCLYFIECGLLITLGIVFFKQIKDDSLKNHQISALYALIVYVLYTLISIATKYTWEINYSYDINFFLSVFVPIIFMDLTYIILFIISKKKAKE